MHASWREILAKPAFFVVYAAGLGLNITFTRAYATHAGSRDGRSAGLLHARCRRADGAAGESDIELAAAGNCPAAQSLPTEQALRLIDKTVALAALVAVAGALSPWCSAAGDRAALPARQFHRRIHPPGVLGLSGAGAESGRLEPARNPGAFSVRAGPAVAPGDRGHDAGADQRLADAGAGSVRPDSSGSARR